ncbi:acyl-CoA thioesterase II [Pseudomonas sp. C27(2019)]|uniref:acyl-CoA thioesterase II n=1 Tax=Pseudomonas sp. C27(2019) TaxID=2604941 RepID=UPI0012440B0A|nr:acyl-CoA thioesterase II [Pseudomonas sp. C27(2019)]QEY59615.1 acyl-CoA thioesterase II [Pseudomonas sp. C27(2019)]
MNSLLDQLVSLLNMETIEENLFRGASQDLGFRQLFGGQVLGQALSAASQTVDSTRQANSLHGYFLRAGDAKKPVVYQVERVRDGGSFSTRRVTAIQNGQPIFTCSASFHQQEQGFRHQTAMPDVPQPEDLIPEEVLSVHLAQALSQEKREKMLRAKAIETRPVQVLDPLNPEISEPIKQVWFKAASPLPQSPALHKHLLAYASDFGLLTTSLLPHGASIWQPQMQVASLDHSIWFHEDVRLDDWLLYSTDSPWAGKSRGFARGSIYSRDGRLVASVAQEGLTRTREDWQHKDIMD